MRLGSPTGAFSARCDKTLYPLGASHEETDVQAADSRLARNFLSRAGSNGFVK